MKRIVLMLILFSTLIPVVVSADLEIDMNMKDSFQLGEVISYDYSITYDANQVIVYVPYILCPTAPVPFSEQKSITLDSNGKHRSTYTGILIEESIESQTCTAYIEILDPIQKTVQKQFEIITDPSLQFTAFTCKDPACLTKGRIYIQNENIYLRYSSDIPDATVTAFLVYPNNVTKQITLPAVIKAESIGTHDVVFTATKERYKTAVQKEQFGVIMQEAKIDYTPLTEEGIAEISETTEFDMNPVTIIAILLVIIVIILIWVFISRSSQPY